MEISGSSEAVKNYRYFVAIYRCHVVTAPPFVIVCDEVKVEYFKEERTYFPSEYRPIVVAAVLHAEYRLPVHAPVGLDANSHHIVLSWRTRRKRSEAQADAEAATDRVVALLAATCSPELFRNLVFRGWLRGPSSSDLGALLRFTDPIRVEAKALQRAYEASSTTIGRNHALRDRFALMSRFVAKGLAEPPGEEAFIWLWTALEVFPMVNTTDIRPIHDFLESYVGRPSAIVKEKLKVGWLFGMRSRIVHDGHMPLDRDGRFSALATLERLVQAVLRHAAGLPYDGKLEFAFNRQ